MSVFVTASFKSGRANRADPQGPRQDIKPTLALPLTHAGSRLRPLELPSLHL